MYDSSTGGGQVWYQVTATGTATTIYSLLSAGDKAELDAIVNGTSTLNEISKKRKVIDGYLIPAASMEVSHRASMSGSETVDADATINMPIYQWHKHTYITGSGTVQIRLILSY